MSLNLLVITGSTRPGRKGPAIAGWAAEAARGHDGFEVSTADLAELALPFLDEPNHPALKSYEKDHTKRWSAIVDAADAFVFVTPEYDYFAPATLVNAIQCLSQEWKYKPAGVVSYGGVSAGLRSAQVLRTLLGNIGAVAIPQGVPLPFFAEFIDDENRFVPTGKVIDGAKLMFAELTKWGTALKAIRQPG